MERRKLPLPWLEKVRVKGMNFQFVRMNLKEVRYGYVQWKKVDRKTFLS